MKKTIAIIFIVCFAAGLVACNNEIVEDTKSNVSQTTLKENSTDSSLNTTETSTPIHTHSYSGANCTEPAKCSCGATDGNALGHNYSEATCTDAPKCSRCGATDGNALGHNYSEATCTDASKCSRCGVINGSPLGHSFSAATCTAPKTCSCGVTEGEAKGHNWEEATYTAPKTCTTCGKTSGKPLDVPGKENYHGHVYTGGSSSKKFHYEAYCAGKNSHEITWDEVKRRGLGPCGTCILK